MLFLSDILRFAWLWISYGAYRLTRAPSFLSFRLLLLLNLPIFRQIANPGGFRSCRCPSICLSTKIAGFLSSLGLVLCRLASWVSFGVFRTLMCNSWWLSVAIFIIALILFFLLIQFLFFSFKQRLVLLDIVVCQESVPLLFIEHSKVLRQDEHIKQLLGLAQHLQLVSSHDWFKYFVDKGPHERICGAAWWSVVLVLSSVVCYLRFWLRLVVHQVEFDLLSISS